MQAQLELPAAELEEFTAYVMAEIEAREQEIEQIWNLPASDLISFDIQLKVGTRDMTKVAQQSMALQLREMDAITIPRLMQDLEYRDWMTAWREKQQEDMQRADAEQKAMQEQLRIERTIDEDEHEQELEVERLKGKYQVEIAEIRARATQRRATQSNNNRSK